MTLAVTTYEWFKTVHVLAVVMWVGGGVTLTLLALMTIALRDPVRLVQFTRQAAFLGGSYFPPLSLMVVGFGFGLVEKGDWSYDRAWILIGIAGWAASFVVGAVTSGRRRSDSRNCSKTGRQATTACRR
jgi:uncharacterized membrane protein